MNSGSFKNITDKKCLESIYLIYMNKKDLALNSLQWLICHKTKQNPRSVSSFGGFEAEDRRQLHKNAASNLEQVLEATPHKTPTVRPPASYHENYSS